MNKAEMQDGLTRGRKLIQEEWSRSDEITAVDELVAEGIAKASPWQYRPGFQCEVRTIEAANPSPVSRAAMAAKRHTIAIPDGHEAVRDADGRATGETRPEVKP